MITNTMNIQEIAYEISKDLPAVGRKINEISPKIRKVALKLRNKSYQQFVSYKSNRLNNWILYFDYNKKVSTFLMMVTYITKQGYNAVIVKGGPHPSFTHYSGHFLERYNQRFLKGENLSKTEIFKRYVVRNSATHVTTSYTENQFFGRTNDGIILGTIDINDNFIWNDSKTFITPEMIHDGQSETLEKTTKLFSDYWNNEWGQSKFQAFHPNVA